tara:strand:- start:128 stop:367 length:240 start_codon:yes stop_codon:yes gene_type:complete
MKILIRNVLVIFLSAGLITEAQPKEKGATVTVDGLIIPRDDGGMYVHSEEQLTQWKAFQAKQRAAREKKAKEKKVKEKK